MSTTIKGLEIDQNVDAAGRWFGYIDGWFVNYRRGGNRLAFDLEADHGDGKSDTPLDSEEAERIVNDAIASLYRGSETFEKIYASVP